MSNFSILAVDTSGAKAYASLLDAEDRLFEAVSTGTNSHNEEIALLVENLFKKSGCSKKDLNLMVIGSGPGSFTGLRIGYSFTQGMASALNIPVVTYSSLKAYAASFHLEDGIYASISDARREEVFFAIFDIKAGELTELSSEKIVSVNEVERQVRELGRKVRLVGFFPNIGVQEPKNVATGLLHLLKQGGIPAPGFSATELALLSPNYLRAVSAKKINERGVLTKTVV